MVSLVSNSTIFNRCSSFLISFLYLVDIPRDSRFVVDPGFVDTRRGHEGLFDGARDILHIGADTAKDFFDHVV